MRRADHLALEGKSSEFVIAVAGNPNVGKSTLFNILTGGRQRVGNWPGKTVERREGERLIDGVKLRFVDLPGTYSLSAFSVEELIARKFIVEDKPHVVIDIVDASNLERNLYLTLQILELTNRVVIALNMMDIAESRGLKIDVKRLSEKLGVPVVPTIAVRGVGVDELINSVIGVAEGRIEVRGIKVYYGDLIESAISRISSMLVDRGVSEKLPYPIRWLAIRLLEGDSEVIREIMAIDSKLIVEVEKIRSELSSALGEDVDVVIADKRYEFIENIVGEVVRKPEVFLETLTDKIDRIVLNRVLGLPILLGVFALLFTLVFSINIGFPLNMFIPGFEEFNLASLIGDRVFGYLAEFSTNYLTSIGAPNWLISLICDGVIAGVGAVLSFYPLVFTIFIFFGLLEDSGYMARAAFIMDRAMKRFGLNGRAFMPLMLGYGCNIPSVMATRILHRWRDRLLAILLSPLIPCQARLAAFMIIIAAVFKSFTAQVVVMLYLYSFSLLSVVLIGSLLNAVFFREEPSTLIMELPPYHRPSLKVVLWHAEERSKHFLLKAGTIIFLMSIVIWFATSYGPGGLVESIDESYAALLGKLVAPFLSPLGLGDWRIAVALIAGFVAKEVIPETLSIIAGVEDPVAAVGSIGLSWSSALALLTFSLLYLPCLATVGVIYRETGSLKWTLFAVLYGLAIAYVASLLVYGIAVLFS